ncbi:hypothetical protein E4U42_001053 [Claviceps africana]|uniref:Early meiotic induction protein 1 n=1 Tax=Claviceps africana TaxID=83212 RepID=A0A8K0NJR8_9HYPO|nr:hypothetical protein E4U42_001053 [Claviceps africana]
MGWLWASSSQPTPQEQPKAPSPAPSPNARQASAPTEPVDPEIQKFLQLLKTDEEESTNTRRHPPPPPTAASSQDSPPSIRSWLSLKASSKPNQPDEAPLLDPLSESLLPTEMSCRQAFDLAWSCNGLAGQFNSVYRHGNMRSCSEHWDDFWFCMRTRAHTGPLKADMIRTHYRNKAYRKYGQDKPSSEDIWEKRTEKLPPGSTFNIPFPEKLDIDT